MNNNEFILGSGDPFHDTELGKSIVVIGTSDMFNEIQLAELMKLENSTGKVVIFLPPDKHIPIKKEITVFDTVQELSLMKPKALVESISSNLPQTRNERRKIKRLEKKKKYDKK